MGEPINSNHGRPQVEPTRSQAILRSLRNVRRSRNRKSQHRQSRCYDELHGMERHRRRNHQLQKGRQDEGWYGHGHRRLPPLHVVWTSLKPAKHSDQALRDAFKVFDKKGTGSVPGEVFKYIMMGCGEPLSEQEMIDLMREADTDGD